MEVVQTEKGQYRVFLSEHDARKVEEYYDEQPIKQLAVRLMLYCGLRISEVIVIDKNHVNGPNKLKLEASETKSQEYRYPAVPQKVTEQIKTVSNLTSGDAIDVTERTVRNWVYSAAQDLAEETAEEDWEKVSPHDLRRYYGSKMIQKGVPLPSVMSYMGHQDYETFRDHYWRPSDEDRADHAAVL